AAGGRRDNVLFVRQGAIDEADNRTVRQAPSRPQLKRDPLGGADPLHAPTGAEFTVHERNTCCADSQSDTPIVYHRWPFLVCSSLALFLPQLNRARLGHWGMISKRGSGKR